MHFKHKSAKIQLKNLKQHFDWGGGGGGAPGVPSGLPFFCGEFLYFISACNVIIKK